MSLISKQLSSITSVTCKGRKEPFSSADIRLVLLGKTGSGKSSTANTILGRKAFDSKVSSSSVTQRRRRACGDVRGRHLTLLNTPGLLDTHQDWTPQGLQKELRKSITLLFPGPHAFLLVLRIGKFAEEEKEAVDRIRQALGPQALAFSVVVFTHGDSLEEGVSVRDCLIEGREGLAELMARCGGRYCVFNNQTSKTKGQVSELLALVDSMMQANRGSCYTSKMLQEAEKEMVRRELWEEMRLLRQEKERRVKKERDDTKAMELRRNQETEKEESLSSEREEAARREREEKNKTEKERKIPEAVKVMDVTREEKTKEVLRDQLDRVTETAEEQTVRENRRRKQTEEMIQKDRAVREKTERERELLQVQKQQATRQREERKRDALQTEFDRFTQEQRRREAARAEHLEEWMRSEREDGQRERERETEDQRAEKKRSESLQRRLWFTTMKTEERKAKEKKREMDERRRKEKERRDEITRRPGNQRDKQCSELRGSAEEHNTVTTCIRPLTGYVQEMGLVVVNVALESIGAPCCTQ